IMFIVLCAVCMVFSGYSPSYVMYELFGRLSRNMFIVLSLIIPIVAGMGINFAITTGAMAAQISCLLVLEWGIPGIGGFLVTVLLTVPLASLFGWLIGKLFNKMKGQEMIGGLVIGYFANGLYQLLFLFIFDNIIPIKNPNLTIKGSKGIANTMDLSKEGGIASSLDKLWRLPFHQAVLVFAAVIAVILIIAHVKSHKKDTKKLVIQLAVLAVAAIVAQLGPVKELFSMVNIPMITYGCVALLCLFNIVIMRTKLGQQFRAVGQNGTVANASGINVNHIRIIAIIFSTVLAGWGQLIFVQNMGAFQTYGAHGQVGLYAGAAILVGGASVVRATNTQAIVGTILFHLMFILAPAAGKNLFGDAAIGEYFRVFLCYGVIAVALVMHAWSENARKKKKSVQ
ncbi:MAG: ABC transporter permease, partial [Clostridiales bacterium]|nr:ABC transporter permease [Clostridiales bacterium]